MDASPLELSPWEQAFIEMQRVARLATVDEQGRPHIVPIVFAFDGRKVFTPIDAKPKRVAPQQLQRVRNIQGNMNTAVLLDEYSEDWSALAWVLMRGRAKLVDYGHEQEVAVALLEARYPQYEVLPLAARPMIVITIQHVSSWRASG